MNLYRVEYLVAQGDTRNPHTPRYLYLEVARKDWLAAARLATSNLPVEIKPTEHIHHIKITHIGEKQ